MPTRPFQCLDLPANRTGEKPRPAGLTSIDDPGLGQAALADLLLGTSRYFDLARLGAAEARLLDEALVRTKLQAYAAHDVATLADGLLIEHAVAGGGAAAAIPVIEESARLGFTRVEISDAFPPAPLGERRALISAVRDAGLGALARIGAGPAPAVGPALSDQAAALLEAGCEAVSIAPGAILGPDGPRRGTLAALAADLDLGRVLFELPRHRGLALARTLITELGVDVGLGAVRPEDALALEGLRSGVGDVRLSAGARRVIIMAET